LALPLSLIFQESRKIDVFLMPLKGGKRMSAPSYIRRRINNLLDDKPFSILACDVETAANMIAHFQQKDRQALRLAAVLMPAWRRDRFARFFRMNCQTSDFPACKPR
jgi:hypothetical protein